MNDQRGNPVGTASQQALEHAETALWRMCSFFDAPIADIDAAVRLRRHTTALLTAALGITGVARSYRRRNK